MYMKETTTVIHLRIDAELLDKLKTVARRVSAELDQNITYNDIIRSAIIKTYPSLVESEIDVNRT